MIAYGVKSGTSMGTRIQRMMQLAQVRFVLVVLDELLETACRSQRQFVLLESVSRGLYEELDKLCAIGPAVPVSARALDELDCFLEEVVTLIRAPLVSAALMRVPLVMIEPYADPFVANFVRPFGPPAPAHYDAVLALRQARQALERYQAWLTARMENIESHLAQAEAIRGALDAAAPFNNGAVLRRDVEQMGGKTHPEWFRNFSYNLSDFDFDRLNTTDIVPYFLTI